MGRQEKIQENTVYHQRMININETALINMMYRGEQTEKKKVKALIKAIVPQLVRDINTEIGIFTLDCRCPDETLDVQKTSIRYCVQGICNTNVKKHIEYIQHYIKNYNTSVKISSSTYGFQKHKDNKVNVTIIADIEINCLDVEDPLHIVLEWCTDLSYTKEAVVFN